MPLLFEIELMPVSVAFTRLHRSKHSILKVDFTKFLTMSVDG